MEPTENDPITRRLHSLGSQPIDPEVVARHRTLMASVPVTSSRSRLRPVMVGSLLAGSLLGGMGLAAAAPGVPDSASDVAKTVLATVTLGAVDDPDEPKAAKAEEAEKAEKAEKADDAEETPAAKAAAQQAKAARKAAKAANHPAGAHGVARSTEGCPTGFTGNHGQYVSSVAQTPGVTEEQKRAAAESNCGKPVQSVKPAGSTSNKPDTQPGKSGDDQGKPDATAERGRSGADHPGDNPSPQAVESVREHRKPDAGRSAGRGPVAGRSAGRGPVAASATP